MPDRPRHPKKELEALICWTEDHGWRVKRKQRYYRAFCPCLQHQKTIHLSPSDPNYELNLRKWFQRQPCWKEAT